MNLDVNDILLGIDMTETESEWGWWETSVGAEFGRKKKEALMEHLACIEKEIKELDLSNNDSLDDVRNDCLHILNKYL